MPQLLGILIEPPRQDWKRERSCRRDESATHEEAGLSRSDLQRLAGNDLFDDRLHGEGGSARIQAVAEERPGLLEDDLIDGLDIVQFRVSAFGLVEFFDQPEAIQLREIRLPARAIDEEIRRQLYAYKAIILRDNVDTPALISRLCDAATTLRTTSITDRAGDMSMGKEIVRVIRCHIEYEFRSRFTSASTK